MDWSRKLDLLTVLPGMLMPSYPYIALPERASTRKDPERSEPICIIMLASLLLLETTSKVTVFTPFSMELLELPVFGLICLNLRSQSSQVTSYSSSSTLMVSISFQVWKLCIMPLMSWCLMLWTCDSFNHRSVTKSSNVEQLSFQVWNFKAGLLISLPQSSTYVIYILHFVK